MATMPIDAWTSEEFIHRHFDERKPLYENLIHTRDFTSLTARRRQGKTAFSLNIAFQGGAGQPFLGYKAPQPFRTLAIFLEDDGGELQEKVKKMLQGRKPNENVKLISKDDFFERKIDIGCKRKPFRDAVEFWADRHKPDLIILDNFAQIVEAEFNDSKEVHILKEWCYGLAKEYNAAILVPAHPKKITDTNPKKMIRLHGNAEMFAEQTMGSSHFINSTGNLWALELDSGSGETTFALGRQRAEGSWCEHVARLDENGWFHLVDSFDKQFAAVCNNRARLEAWNALPKLFSFNEGWKMVNKIISSKSTYSNFIRQCLQAKLLVRDSGGRFEKVRF